MNLAKNQLLAIIAVAIIGVAAGAVLLLDDNDDDDDDHFRDASGNILKQSYDDSRIVTVGVGTLRWTSYFGMETNVVCIDAGDANAASWNGKGYRTLINIGSGLTVSGSSMEPRESDYTTYGMAIHDHNNFSTGNLTTMAQWSTTNMPTLMIVSNSVYDQFNNEMKEGIDRLGIDVVVIYEVETFLDNGFEVSDLFEDNVDILSHVFNEKQRGDNLENGIENLVREMRQMVSGKTPALDKVYIGGASNAGAKALNNSVQNYLPFKIAGVDNILNGNNTVSQEYNSDVLSGTDVEVIFLDLSSTTKHSESGSQAMLTYANLNDVPVYTLLPYFWFGYNFDNALANAYLVMYACYPDLMTFEQCQDKIADVYELFYPNLADGTGYTCVDNMMDNYYSTKGSKLVIDGVEMRVDSNLKVVPAE